ncbi:MAG: hypothetical protein AAF437_00275 [Pseudomonadota bacterium]
MKSKVTQSLAAAAIMFGATGLVSMAQELESPVEVTEAEVDAVLDELLDLELDVCEGDEACIDEVLARYESDPDVSEEAVAAEAVAVEATSVEADLGQSTATETVDAVAEGQAAAAEPAAQGEAAASMAAEAGAADDGAVLNSAGEADEDTGGTGGTTRPNSRPD